MDSEKCLNLAQAHSVCRELYLQTKPYDEEKLQRDRP